MRDRSASLVRAERRAFVASYEDFRAEKLPKRTGFGELYGVYCTELRAAGKDTSDQESCFRMYMADAFGRRRPGDVLTADLAAWVLAMRSAGLANKYVLKVHGFMRAALECAHSHGLLDVNPARRMPRGVLPPNETRPDFDPALELPLLDEVVRLLSHPKIPIFRRVRYALLACTGERPGESYESRFGDLERARPLWRLNITRTFSRKAGCVRPIKNKKHRTAPVHIDLLSPLIEEAREAYRPTFGRAAGLDDLISPHIGKDGSPRHTPDNSALRHFHEDLELCGIDPRKRLHSFRHWFISTLIDLGGPERTVTSITHPPRRAEAKDHYIVTSWPAKCAAVSRLEAKLLPPLLAIAESAQGENR